MGLVNILRRSPLGLPAMPSLQTCVIMTRNDIRRWNTHPLIQQDQHCKPLLLLHAREEQNIHRAELQAIVELCQALPAGGVHTDSQVALSAIQQCQVLLLPQLQHLDNYDLICRLWTTLQTKPFQFCKVSAHSNFHDNSNTLEACHQMGNQEANDRAIWACWNLQKEMIQDWIGQCKWVEIQQYLEQLFFLHLGLSRARMKLAQQCKQEERHLRTSSRNSILEIFFQLDNTGGVASSTTTVGFFRWNHMGPLHRHQV